MPQSTCGFGTVGFDTTASKTFQPFLNVSYKNGFANGNTVTGPVGFDTVTVGGLSAPHQEIAVPTHAVHMGDNITSGILVRLFSLGIPAFYLFCAQGLAFPALTNVFNTTDPTS